MQPSPKIGRELIELLAITTLVTMLCFGCAGQALRGAQTADPYWHIYADVVAFPELQAALNRWAIGHPRDPAGQEQSMPHTRGYDAKLKQHTDAIRDKYREWNDAMKKAGY